MKTSVWVIVKCEGTGRYMLGLRGKRMNNPGLWNFFGGSADPGESLINAALRELKEEAGLTGNLHSLGSIVSPVQHMFYYLLSIRTEVTPVLDHETAIAKWVGLKKLVKLYELRRLHGPTAEFLRSSLVSNI